MTDRDPDETAERIETEPDGGVPSNHELTTRMARLEAKQDHLIETTDRIDGRLETVANQHDVMWLGFQALKWFLVVLSGGGVGALVLQTVL